MDNYQIFDFGILSLQWPTLLFGVVVFAITLFFLNLWLFRPILRNFHAKADYKTSLEQETAGYTEQIQSQHHKIDQVHKKQLQDLNALQAEHNKHVQAELGLILENAKNELKEKNLRKANARQKEWEQALMQASDFASKTKGALIDKLKL